MLPRLREFLDQWFVIFGGVSALVGGWLYIESFSNRLDEAIVEIHRAADIEAARDSEWMDMDEGAHVGIMEMLAEVRDDQAEIRRELATQTIQLQQIVNDGDLRFQQRENRFEELENGQARIADNMVTLAVTIGELSAVLDHYYELHILAEREQ